MRVPVLYLFLEKEKNRKICYFCMFGFKLIYLFLRSGRLLPSFGPRFGSSSNRRSDVGADNSVDGSAIVGGGEYQRRRRQRYTTSS